MNPLDALRGDRQRARDEKDPWAALCALGTRTASGVAQRTLVLRDLGEELALFFSATSPKWRELDGTPQLSLLIYLPSIQVQYRLQANWSRVPDAVLYESWQSRPDIPKRLDWFYQSEPQSTPVDRATLVTALMEDDTVPGAAPPTAVGIIIDPIEVERLVLSQGVHERTCYRRGEDGDWLAEDLVP
ncbi:MAG: hypothetical protein AAF515_12905 [Pseudomonadota bacterium]